MVTCVLAKTKKAENNLLTERKSSKKYSVVFLVERKKFNYEFTFEDFIFVVGPAANSFGTTLEFAAFRSGSDDKSGRASAFFFFSVHNYGFCGGPNTFSQEKHQAFSCR